MDVKIHFHKARLKALKYLFAWTLTHVTLLFSTAPPHYRHRWLGTSLALVRRCRKIYTNNLRTLTAKYCVPSKFLGWLVIKLKLLVAQSFTELLTAEVQIYDRIVTTYSNVAYLYWYRQMKFVTVRTLVLTSDCIRAYRNNAFCSCTGRMK